MRKGPFGGLFCVSAGLKTRRPEHSGRRFFTPLGEIDAAARGSGSVKLGVRQCPRISLSRLIYSAPAVRRQVLSPKKAKIAVNVAEYTYKRLYGAGGCVPDFRRIAQIAQRWGENTPIRVIFTANLLAGLYRFKPINIENVIKLTNYLDDAIVYANPRY